MIRTRAGAVLVGAGLLVALLAGTAAAAGPPRSSWQSTAPGGAKHFGTSDVIRNSISCPCGGHQRIWADSTSHWGVYAEEAAANTNPVSYPDVQVLEYNLIKKMPILQGHYQLIEPPQGAYVAAFDLSIQDNPAQNLAGNTKVSVWVDKHGDMKPAGIQQPVAADMKIYGRPFALWSTAAKGQTGQALTLVFDSSPQGVAHLAFILSWLQTHGWISPKAEDLDVAFGWHIRSTNGSYENFQSNNFLLYQPFSSPYGAEAAAPGVPWPLAVGLGGLFIAVFALALLVLGKFARTGRQRDLADRIEKYGPRHRPVTVQENSQTKLSGAAVDAVSRMMSPVAQERLGKRLDLAGVARKPAEWTLLGVCVGVVIAAMLSVFTSYVWLGLLAGTLIGWLSMRMTLSMRILRRRVTFSEQLPDLLQLIASSLQSGFSLPQALDAVVRDDSQPAAGEFARALAEARLGASLEDALDAVADRMASDDLRWTVMAIRIQQGVGGNLAEVLLTIVSTIRERSFLRRHVRALSAEGRLSAYILIAMPILVGTWLFISSPQYMRVLYTTAAGKLLLVLAATLLVIGALWMRKMIRVEV